MLCRGASLLLRPWRRSFVRPSKEAKMFKWKDKTVESWEFVDAANRLIGQVDGFDGENDWAWRLYRGRKGGPNYLITAGVEAERDAAEKACEIAARRAARDGFDVVLHLAERPIRLRCGFCDFWLEPDKKKLMREHVHGCQMWNADFPKEQQ